MKDPASHIAFSIVIPLNNKAATIERTLRSVLEQEHQNWELIVVNDGCTDGSETIAEQNPDPRIHVIHQQNQGVSVARNTGISRAKGPWLALLDADDWWDPAFLSSLAKAIADHPDYSIFCTGRSFVYPDQMKRLKGKWLPPDGTAGPVDHFRILTQGRPVINSSNVVFHKERTPVVFEPGMTQYEDHEAWFKLCLGRSIYMINKPFSFYDKTAATSASGRRPTYANMERYVRTIHQVWSEAGPGQRADIQRFVNRFFVSLLLKKQYGYTKTQRASLYQLLQPMLQPVVRGWGRVQNRWSR